MYPKAHLCLNRFDARLRRLIQVPQRGIDHVDSDEQYCSEREAQADVAEACEALEVAVAEQDDQDDGGKLKRQAVELGAGHEEDRDHDEGEGENKFLAEQAGGNGAVGGAGGDHGDEDPAEGRQAGEAVEAGGHSLRGKDGAGVGEGEREDGMLLLDHFESDVDACAQAMRKP